MHKGQIIFYRADKGYGYLRLIGTLEEFYFKGSAFDQADKLEPGDLVRFKLSVSKQGMQAIEITRSLLA